MCPAKVKRGTIDKPGGPWSTNLACALFEQGTIIRAAIEVLFEILAGKVS